MQSHVMKKYWHRVEQNQAGKLVRTMNASACSFDVHKQPEPKEPDIGEPPPTYPPTKPPVQPPPTYPPNRPPVEPPPTHPPEEPPVETPDHPPRVPPGTPPPPIKEPVESGIK